MEDDGTQEVKESLGFFLGLIWSFGIPRLGVRCIWRLTYALMLILLYSAAYGFLIPKWIAMLFQSEGDDIGALLTTRIFAGIYTYAITIVWATRGDDIVQKTMLDLAKVDVIIRDFRVMKKGLSLRQAQVLWIGLFLMWCSTEIIANVILGYIHLGEIRPAITTHHHSFDWIFSLVHCFQLLTLDILFSAIILAIRDRFRRINIALYEMGTGCFDRKAKSIVVHNCGRRTTKPKLAKLFDDLDQLCEIHKRLRDIAERFSRVFSVALLLALLTGLTSSLGYAFVMSTLIRRGSHDSDIILTRGFTLFYNIVRSWMIVWSCSCLIAEANKIGLLLHRINASGLAFHKKLRELSIKHCQEKLEIVAGGVLPVDYSWFKIVLFTVTAYAVFILQMDIPDGFIPQ